MYKFFLTQKRFWKIGSAASPHEQHSDYFMVLEILLVNFNITNRRLIYVVNIYSKCINTINKARFTCVGGSNGKGWWPETYSSNSYVNWWKLIFFEEN